MIMIMNKIVISAFITAAVFISFIFGGTVSGTSGCDEDCTKCHSLKLDEAAEILRSMKITDARVIDVQMSPLKGLWEINVEKEGKRGLFYIDFSKQFIVSGSIIEIKTSVNKTQEKLSDSPVAHIPQKKIPLKEALILGNKISQKKVIIFTDPDCPFCNKLHAELKKIVETRKDIAFYIKLLPLKMHKDAYSKSKAILCEKSLKFLEDNFEGKQIPKPSCEAKEIDENIKLAEKLGITGTPTIIMPDGRVFQGFFTADKLLSLIDST